MENVAHAPREGAPTLLSSTLRRLRSALGQPRDNASLAAFRILFGSLLCIAFLRAMELGWIERFYGGTRMHFVFWAAPWAKPLGIGGMYVVYSALAGLALLIALGLFYRVATALFFLGFTYVELIDVTNYLNHYYLVSLLAGLLVFIPAHRRWSLDVWRRPSLGAGEAPAWALGLLRFQIGVVYIFAALAKFSPDWLLHGQPLGIWLSARTDTPLVGPWLGEGWVALAASWAAFLYDLTIVFWLSWRRTRPLAFAALLGFHAATHLLFDIGIFPFLMTVCATVFFAPEWPRRLLRIPRRENAQAQIRPPSSLGVAALVAYAALQLALPLRHLAYPGNVLWTEEGMRWSWRVMVREKHGSISYRVRVPSAGGRELRISPRRYLNARQEREMAGQPDLILQLAHRIAADFRERGYPAVEVYADSAVSLNGRPAAPLIDPTVDLARVSGDLRPAAWIARDPTSSPLRLSSIRRGSL